MKFCAQCGEQLADDDVFCPICGAAQSAPENGPETSESDDLSGNADDNGYAGEASGFEAEAPKKKKKLKIKPKAIIAIALVAAIVAGIAALIISGAYGALLPHGKLKLKLGAAEKKLLKEIYNDPMLRGVDTKRFALEMDFDLDGFDEIDSDVADILDMLTVNLEYDTVNKGIAASADLKGNTVADLRLLCDGEEVGIYVSPASDDYYIANVNSLIETLSDRSDLPDIDLDILFELLDTDLVKKDLYNVLGVAAKALAKADTELDKNVEVELFGEEELEKCVVYNIELDEEVIEKVINDVADYLDSNKCYIKKYYDNWYESPIIELIAKLADDVGYYDNGMSSGHGGSSSSYIAMNSDGDFGDFTGNSDYSWDYDFGDDNDGYFDDGDYYAFYGEPEYSSGGSSILNMSFSELIDELRDNAEELAEELAESNPRLQVVMKGNSIVRQFFYTEDVGVGYDSLKTGKTTRTMFYYSYDPETIAEDYELSDIESVIDYTIKTNGSKREIEATMRDELDEDPTLTVTANIDTSSRSAIGTYAGDYKLTYNISYSYGLYYSYEYNIEASMKVSRSGSGMMHKITVDMDGESLGVNMLVSEGKGVKAPSGASKEDISDYSYRELEALVERLGEKLYNKLGKYFDF